MTRNEQISQDREAGLSYAALSAKYGISPTTCKKIYEKNIQGIELMQDEIFKALCAINDDMRQNKRVYMMLTRNNIHTTEEFLAITERICKKFRNCGPQAIEIIRLAQEYIALNRTNEEFEELKE